MSGETKTALVLDATGGIGGATAEALARHGWKVRALSRGGAPARRKEEWEWVKGDSMDRASIVAAAKGTHTVVHAVNPPGYRNWSQLVLPMIENTIPAAKESGARILLPGTIYNYGPLSCRPTPARGVRLKMYSAEVQILRALLERAVSRGTSSTQRSPHRAKFAKCLAI